MRKLRVLIVDDSIVIRRVLSGIIESDPGLGVAGVAANGKIALAKLRQLQIDIVTLDLEMPVMDGMEALREIRKIYPKLPVVVFSTATERGAVTTLDALAAGASDYVTKPSGVKSLQESMSQVRVDLLAKLHALCGNATVVISEPARVKQPVVRRARRRVRWQGARVEIVVIGCSTGGPNALSELIPRLHADFAVPVAVVQHMPPMFTRHLAERLDRASPLRVREAVEGATVEPGTVWIAPGDFHIELVRERERVELRLNQRERENFCRPSADVLLRSAADVYGAGSMAVILTGLGQDGLLGCEMIADAGGRIAVQDAASSVVWGMPGSVANAGLAGQVLPIEKIADHLNVTVRQKRTPALPDLRRDPNDCGQEGQGMA